MTRNTKSIVELMPSGWVQLRSYLVEAAPDDSEFFIAAPNKIAAMEVLQERIKLKRLREGVRRIFPQPMRPV